MRLEPPPKTKHPVDVGIRSEAAIITELVRRGYNVLTPFGFNHRYDLVIDLQGQFVRAQCKTGRLKRGAIEFRTRSTRTNRKEILFRDYYGEIDLFLVYCPQNEGLYAVPIDDVTTASVSLRVEPTRNHQARGVRWAEHYELPG